MSFPDWPGSKPGIQSLHLRTILTNERPPAITCDTDIARTAFGSGRITGQRLTIARAAAGMRGAFTVEELAESLRDGASSSGTAPVGTATVYRAVAAMESTGFLSRVGSRAGSALFARCSEPSHHHHIVCDACGRFTATPCPIVAPVVSPEATGGFVVTRHEVTLYGLCGECARPEGS